MATMFETAILTMRDLGFFKFLFPFILTAAVMYGMLRKTQIFGDPSKNIAVNAVIALIASMFVWAMPVILGIDIETQLAAFFLQGIAVTLVVMIGLVIIGMFFPPDIAKSLGEKIKGGWFWGVIVTAGILIGIILLISSGLYKVLFPGGGIGISISNDTLITFGVIALLLGTLVLMVRTGGK